MYYNIAERTIRPALEECYGNVASAAAETQRIVNKSVGVNITPQKAPLNSDRIAGIIDRATEAEQFDDVSWILKDPVVNFSQSVVDDTVKANAEFHSRAGLTPKIVRRAEHKCCKWCSDLEGTYDYPDDVPDDIFRRHENCRCTVEMHSEKGIQNAHTKKWRDPNETNKIEERRKINIQSDVFRVSDFEKLPNKSKELLSNAKVGKRHAGVYVDAQNKSVNQLRKSIINHSAQVERHNDKILNPEKYDIDWDKKTQEQKNGLLKKWKKDADRNAEQAQIEIEVWKERFGK